MTPKARTAFVIVFGLTTVAAGTEALRAEDAPSVSVTLSSPRTTLVQYEPLILDIHIGNPGITKHMINEPESLAYDFTVRIIDPNGETRRYMSGGGARETKRLELEPGHTHTCRFVVHYGGLYRGNRMQGGMGYAFPRAGRYTVSVQYPPREGALGALEVRVSEPVDRDREALALFRGRKQAAFPGDFNAKVPPTEFKRLATEYSHTVYGRYARFWLAAAVLQHRFDWKEARRKFASELVGLDPFAAELQLRKEVYRQTASEFGDLAKNEPAFPLADQCLLYQAQCYTRSPANRQAEAAKILRDLVAKYPESLAADKARKRLEKLPKETAAPPTPPPAP